MEAEMEVPEGEALSLVSTPLPIGNTTCRPHPGDAWMRTYPRIPPQYCFLLRNRNTEKPQYCSIAIHVLQYAQYQTIFKYVQYTATLDVLRAPGRTEVYPAKTTHRHRERSAKSNYMNCFQRTCEPYGVKHREQERCRRAFPLICESLSF